ncbi:DNA polymerase III subunit epsilon [Lutimaribacter sp. EGI FJ00015]|uniref:DNA polymerase III subunit epsilon n=1 Tax=Lutimaribacter degradans TaxID=2945989 RepID=A0ACC5ZVW0_9RHOB|nr:DNA polymerase III subunit epsilon [Lutimaribacter sp. EGI FJ00013]MCM2561980.1 DNA polymerase III subunit epsilon [Lutimaribacter sp. EGI FJ00013]MCO0612988.1 DNA polymerase III subunit epsilon [Lutimaribacter sp. EGI FJ00015]MCO0635812.1 DNA polymerase III subunit epsilon [Lutimaribacter sp. EGI FJ00014]
MREIVLDTETTGFEPDQGDRIVEIGAIELYNHMPTGRTYHQYINPERDMPDGAFEIHGIGPDLLVNPRPPKDGEVILRDKPVFKEIGHAFFEFVADSRLVIHNAAFDMKFLNAELRWMGLPELHWERAIDTLGMARQKFPGSPASLDALCRRFGIDNASRTLHGALLDSEILAEVYLELIGGRQPDFALGVVQSGGSGAENSAWKPKPRPAPLPSRLTKEEAAAHDAFVQAMGDGALWSKLG